MKIVKANTQGCINLKTQIQNSIVSHVSSNKCLCLLIMCDNSVEYYLYDLWPDYLYYGSWSVFTAVAALFSQVAVLAAVLALVVIFIMSVIILIAVWRKVRQTLICNYNYVEWKWFRFSSCGICLSPTALSETSLRDQMEGDRICEPGWARVHLRGPHPPALWPGLGDAPRQPGAGWVLMQTTE